MAFVNDVSGDSPAIDPQHGTRMTDVDFHIPTATGSSDSGDLNISVLRPGDITFEFKKRSAEGLHPGDDALELGTDVYASPVRRSETETTLLTRSFKATLSQWICPANPS